MNHHEEEEIPLTPTTEGFTEGRTTTATRDSMMTYSTDIGSSSIEDSVTTDFRYHNEEKSKNQQSFSGQRGDGPTPFYKRKRYWAICAAVTVIFNAIFLPLLFLVIVPNIAQNAINNAVLTIVSMNMSDLTNDGFTTDTLGKSAASSPFDATMTVNGDVDIYYNGSIVGSTALDEPIKITKGSGVFYDPKKKFIIRDKPLFSKLSSIMMTASSFEWTMKASINIQTLGMTLNNLDLNKTITIPGSGGFANSAKLVNFTSIRSDNQSYMLITTDLYNPSPIGIELGDMYFQLSYNDYVVSYMVSKDVSLYNKDNTIYTLGTLNPPKTLQEQHDLGVLFTSYAFKTPITLTSKVAKIVPKNGPVDWLNDATSGLTITTTLNG